MKIFSKMLSKKIEPTEGLGAVDPEEKDASLALRADDSGRINSSQVTASDPVFADPSHPIQQKAEEPEVAGTGWEESDWDDDDWDDDDWDDDDDDIDMEARRRTSDKQHLVSEIRDAMVAADRVRSERPVTRPQTRPQSMTPEAPNWSEDDEFGRKALARDQLGKFGGEAEDRILEKTETVMTDRETSRRRSAMAHLKAAAAATKADRVLSHVAGQDDSADDEEQSPYRDDLAKVVRPHSTSRPISRQVSRPNTRSPIWDQGAGDEDAALFAAAEDGADDLSAKTIEDELAAAEAERLARAPADLSEEDFADDTAFGGTAPETSAFPSSRFAGGAVAQDDGDQSNAFGDFGDDEFEDEDFDDEDDEFAPRPSRVVSEAVAFANAPDEDVDPQPAEAEVRKKIWEMADEVAADIQKASAEAPPENFVEVSTAVAGRAGRNAGGRVKTRLLGFQAEDQGPGDVFQATAEKTTAAENAVPGEAGQPSKFPAGWIVVISGPGRGACFTLHSGVSQIGRGEEQAVRLDFGDTSISRNNHAAVAYDDEQGKFYLGHGGKSNLVRLNGMPVLSTEEMSNGDEIRIGETTLKFVAMCGESFTWASQGDDVADA